MTQPTVSVVVCAYTDRRWADLSDAAAAVAKQLGPADELVVVIDHNDDLLARAQAELPATRIVPNEQTRGLSGGRNTGVAQSRGDVVVFLDDDAVPEAGWLEAFRVRFADPDVVAVGGAVEAEWETGSAPRWFPAEFGWVVGCDYVGLPEDGEQIRNPIGASMAIRRTALETVGGFSDAVGRVGALPVGCEETDLCIRVRQAMPAAAVVRDTTAVVRHRVPAARRRFRYFVSRCYHEGRSKAILSASVGATDGLSSERSYATKVLPRGTLRHAGAIRRGDLSGLARAAAIPVGLVVTATGYASATLRRSARV
ncbi:MAG: glycosyltransferase family 2 protein [Actinomycetota bacterium]|nr:MAG: glycosyltransferase family 2 protein [Actinomycetota bacterium]